MPWPEGYDVNDLTDFEFLEYLISKNPKLLSSRKKL
jgi:hypothetical protein